ncbi:MAG: penicillin acylase family protein [Pseudomonadota bacterium]
MIHRSIAVILTGCAVIFALTGCASMNRYQSTGDLSLAGLTAPVTVHRDEKGMAFIYAGNRRDALVAYGFVTAQDRLFQMELVRRLAEGRICELAGDKALALDRRMRTIGFYRQAQRHAALLDDNTRRHFEAYLDGVNAYIGTREEFWPLEFKLAGIRPTPWTVADSLAIFYYMSWNSSANLHTEIIMQMLVEKLGPQRAMALMPININPDDPLGARGAGDAPAARFAATGRPLTDGLAAFLEDGPLRVGSNNWVVGPKMTAAGKPILANDPHLDVRMLPGPWYPAGLILPEQRIVGVGIPGISSMVIFRNDYIATGLTNAYADAQDLYVEDVDPDQPDHYREGERSIPFETVTEEIRVKDKSAPDGFRSESLKIRLTRRGPVVSGVLPGLETSRVITLRWAPFETMGPRTGVESFMFAKSAQDFRSVLADVNWMMLNFVFADTGGNIGWVSSGKIPIRAEGTGTVPTAVTGPQDTWTGWIPFDEMPQAMNPAKGWVGTCNHKTVSADYPYYYSSYFASSYRYRRLKEIMESAAETTGADHWRFQQDTVNTMAMTMAPIFARILKVSPDTRDMAKILDAWDYSDDPDKAAPAIFQAVYRELARATFEDELGPDLAATMLESWYFWQERFQRMVVAEAGPWFDDVSTPEVREDFTDRVLTAGAAARSWLSERMGSDPYRWRWGKVHTITYLSPVRRSGLGQGVMGGGTHAYPGSGETLYRGIYDFKTPFDVTVSAALRMVVDFSDPDRIMAILPGGVTGRVFHPHHTDQIETFLSGAQAWWWFSDAAIAAHTTDTLVLQP